MADKLIDLSCRDFVAALGSSAAVPGGGGAAGLGGAVGMALINMVIRLTIGKKKYAQYEGELQELLQKGEALQEEILQRVDADAEAFEPLSKAYALPKGTDEEKAKKAEVLSAAAIDACNVPLEVASLLVQGMGIAKRVAEIGSLLVISDVACGVEMMCAAVKCAEQNVRINLGSIQNAEYVEQAAEGINQLLLEADMKRSQALQNIKNR